MPVEDINIVFTKTKYRHKHKYSEFSEIENTLVDFRMFSHEFHFINNNGLSFMNIVDC